MNHSVHGYVNFSAGKYYYHYDSICFSFASEIASKRHLHFERDGVHTRYTDCYVHTYYYIILYVYYAILRFVIIQTIHRRRWLRVQSENASYVYMQYILL